MNREHFQRAQEVFLAARVLSAVERTALLERECSATPGLRETVEGMLAAESQDPNFLGASPFGPEKFSGGHRARIQKLVTQSNAGRRLVVENEVARGGMGSILKVHDVDLRRTLAMKVIRGQSGASSTGEVPGVQPNLVERFLEEAQVTGRLEHPGVVPIHELGVDSEGRLYFTMPLVGGRTLAEVFDHVRDEDPKWSRTGALGLLQKVCETMAYSHHVGVVHRDLKPANVMVGDFGEVYVMDWGLARVREATNARDIRPADEADNDRTRLLDADSPLRTRDGAVLGTPSYMSPEQALGESERVDAASDIYALGSMLYHLLVGAAPYTSEESRNSREVLAAVRRGPPPSIESLAPKTPAELVAICERAMAREPEDRYLDMAAFASDLQAYLEGRVVRAHRTGAWVELRKWVGRNRLAASVAAIALVAVLLGVVGVAAAERRSADLSRSFMIFYLEEEANTLWPAVPEMIPGMEQWLTDAQELGARIETAIAGLPGDSQVLAERQAGMRASNQRIKNLRVKMEDRLAFAASIEELTRTSPEARAAWNTAVASIAASERYQRVEPFQLTPQLGLFPLGENPTTGLWEFWHVQSGLRPELNPNWSEDALEWNPETPGSCNRWIIGEETGIVFVLIPRGTFRMGAERPPVGVEYEVTADGLRVSLVEPGSLADRAGIQIDDVLQSVNKVPIRNVKQFDSRLHTLRPGIDTEFAVRRGNEERVLSAEVKIGFGSPNINPWTESDSGPIHDVTLQPYFISKYEMTQGQWLRSPVEILDPSTRGKPFRQTPDPRLGIPDHIVDRSHPVESVSWFDSYQTLERLGLSLPTEAQWERAARAGTGTRFWPGNRIVDLQGKENIGDATAAQTVPGWAASMLVNDRFVAHAPVGSFEPNGFGLHDALGNVSEWSREASVRGYPDPVQDEDGARGPGPEVATSHRVARGGQFTRAGIGVAGRWWVPSRSVVEVLGVRPARGIQD